MMIAMRGHCIVTALVIQMASIHGVWNILTIGFWAHLFKTIVIVVKANNLLMSGGAHVP